MPYAAVARARMSRARPTVAMFKGWWFARSLVLPLGGPLTPARGVFGELRRALRDERVTLAHERRALLADGHDDLAALAEGVRHRTAVGDRDRGRAVAVTDAERQPVGAGAHRAGLHLAGELVGDARLRCHELARGDGLARRAEARDDERRRQHDRRRERDDEPDPALAGRMHDRPVSQPSRMTPRGA